MFTYTVLMAFVMPRARDTNSMPMNDVVNSITGNVQGFGLVSMKVILFTEQRTLSKREFVVPTEETEETKFPFPDD